MNDNDSERLNWLGSYTSRLQDVYWQMANNEDMGIREAIDYLISINTDDK